MRNTDFLYTLRKLVPKQFPHTLLKLVPETIESVSVIKMKLIPKQFKSACSPGAPDGSNIRTSRLTTNNSSQ